MSELKPWIPKTKPYAYVQMLSEVEDYNLKMMNIPLMWATTKGKGIRVAVLDTGTPTHDDVPVKGKFSCVPNYMYDENGHGTASASVIGAIAGNGMGVAGVAPECELYTCAVLDKNGSGMPDWIASGIRWAVDVAKAHIINMSLGMTKTPISKKLLEACEYANSQGVVVVAAVGNEHGQVCQPACYPTVIAVGAVNDKQSPADFSNMGEEVDFVAGGVDCYMAYLHNGFAKQSGSSFSSPALAGVAALIMSEALNRPEPKLLTPDEVHATIQKICVDLQNPGRDFQTGYGIPLFGYTNPEPNEPGLLMDTKTPSDLALALSKAFTAEALEKLGAECTAASLIRKATNV